MDVAIIDCTEQYIHCQVTPKSPVIATTYYITAVYASNTFSERLSLWNSLIRLSGSMQASSWCIGGDFNEVRYNSEKLGGRPIHSRRVRKFNNCILSCSLEDLKSTGHTLSWNNQQENRICCRLDRIMANPTFFAAFPYAVVHYLPSGPSDHAALRLQHCPPIPTGPQPFRYFEMWETHPQFAQVVEEAWQQTVNGSPLFQLVNRLSNVKAALKVWNKNVFGNIQNHIRNSREILESAQLILHGDPLNSELIKAETTARMQYQSVLKTEEGFLRQKSRQQWLQLGDKNSKYFYASIKARSSRNTISCLRTTGGDLCTDPTFIKDSIVSYFTELLNRESGRQVSPLCFPRNISMSQNDMLTENITVEEVKLAVFSLKALSSPGPDGFPARFYQRFWLQISDDLLLAIQHFFEHGYLLRQISNSFISLIPKTANAESLDGYRPISLCNTLYKIITKIMATRLQKSLPSIISPHQTAFVKGRKTPYGRIGSSYVIYADLIYGITPHHRIAPVHGNKSSSPGGGLLEGFDILYLRGKPSIFGRIRGSMVAA
ncbi:hypothetical protein QJS10_CPA03g01344 [Acorus calamus]|uniref:Reverse transcriptase domain-containing protein n=1 Tax=Acorus calamus TaxID=4465 RepID=A0AAV9FAY3_ACOCL|nr:hypothetical protein QJS10_CPA03g01344 [Acorus calamus]